MALRATLNRTPVTPASGTTTSTPTLVVFDQVEARYVRITQTGSSTNNWWSIHEINLYSDSAQPSGIALDASGWTFSSSTTGLEYKATDKDSNTRWTTGAKQQNGQYFMIDMKSMKLINKIVLDTALSPNDYPRGYSVSVSTDGANWGESIASGVGSGPTTTINIPKLSTRYLKITQTGAVEFYWWSIHSLKVYGSN